MKKVSSLLVSIFCLYFNQNFLSAQENIPKYPQGYFRNPLDIPMSLAGNFGECRPNHFHSGLDIKTNGKENYVVRAAAEGYVSRIKIERGGFGHALYLTHPNGFTTVYAHLNDFMPELQKFLREKQYEKQNWTADIHLTPEQFPVKQGEQIAWSGNTGGSMAPHLHFEIRDSRTEHPLNGSLFGLDIMDTQAPIPMEIAIYDLGNNFYEQSPQYFKLTRRGESYTIKDSVLAPGTTIGISVAVNDFMNGSTNTLNFYQAKWYLDDSLQGIITLDDIGYEETRYLHAYADYRSKVKRGEWFQCLFKMPGNQLSIYEKLNNANGALVISDSKPHTVKIELTDPFGNATMIDFLLFPKGAAEHNVCEELMYHQPKTLYPFPNLELIFGSKVFYDNVCLNVAANPDKAAFSDRYDVGQSFIPAHDYYTVKIKPNKPVPFAQRNKMVLVYSDGKSETGKAAAPDNDWYKASVRNFGSYYLKADVTPPIIKNLQKSGDLSKAKSIRFDVKEETTSVTDFRAELDGKWILFEPFNGIYVYKFDEHCSKGKHELIVKVKDENNNERILKYDFIR